ncbi:Amidohydrolase [compost metagenome]
MLDHLGKPAIKAGEINEWKMHIKALAENPNVFCKLSGLITEADWQSWTVTDLEPYFYYAIEQFGFDRLVFGSDWPVVTLAGSYEKWMNSFLTMCRAFAEHDIKKILYENALKFYKLN